MKELSCRMRQVTGSVTLSIDAKAKEMKRAGANVISFGAGEPDFDTPPHIIEAGIRAMREGQTRYTPARGTLALRQTISEKFMRRNGLDYSPAQIVVTNGAKQALCNTFFALLNPGDEAILLAPCWVSYAELVRMAGGEPKLVQRKREDGFQLNLDDLDRAVTDRTRFIMLNTPDNPCGNVITKQELMMIAEFAKKHDLYIVSDEIYEDFVYDGKAPDSIATLSEDAYRRTILINGVSKSYAMTGWRLGYSACDESIATKMGDWQSHATGNVNAIAQAAAIEAISGDQSCVKAMVNEFKTRRDVLAQGLNATPQLSCRVPQGAFYIMADITQAIGKKAGGVEITNSHSFATLLLEQAQVAVVPGYAFFAENMVRLSYALSMDNLLTGLDKIQVFMHNLQQ